jgi:alpha-glucoside transport system permease protein
LTRRGRTTFIQPRQLAGRRLELLGPAAFISMAPPLAVFFALQRYFVRGITDGAVKG